MSEAGYRESLGTRLARRSLTIPTVFLAAALGWITLPAWLPVCLLVDLLRPARLRTTRFALFGLGYLSYEVAGLLASLGIWLGWGPWRRAPQHHYLDRNHRLQAWWAGGLFRAATRILSLEVHLDEAPADDRPLLVFVRHASMVDSLLPAALVSARAGTQLRYVLKRELLLDPCLDVVGQRLPNAFVKRGSTSPEQELEAVRALARDLGPGEGVAIFPEGTRFTPEKRERALERIAASGDPERLERARGLRRVLPPRSGGPLAVIAEAPEADVFFLAHRGFDGAASVSDLLAGRLIGRRIDVRSWRVPICELPTSPREQLRWLDEQWAILDQWVDEGPAAFASSAANEKETS